MRNSKKSFTQTLKKSLQKSPADMVLIVMAGLSMAVVIGAFGFLNYHMIANSTTAQQSLDAITASNNQQQL